MGCHSLISTWLHFVLRFSAFSLFSLFYGFLYILLPRVRIWDLAAQAQAPYTKLKVSLSSAKSVPPLVPTPTLPPLLSHLFLVYAFSNMYFVLSTFLHSTSWGFPPSSRIFPRLCMFLTFSSFLTCRDELRSTRSFPFFF